MASPSEREALAALLHEQYVGCEAFRGDDPDSGMEGHREDADRLIAAGVRLTPAGEPPDLREALRKAVASMAFLRSVIASGEYLSDADEAQLREVYETARAVLAVSAGEPRVGELDALAIEWLAAKRAYVAHVSRDRRPGEEPDFEPWNRATEAERRLVAAIDRLTGATEPTP